MASYRIELRRSAFKELRKLDATIVPRILRAVKQLGTDPRPDSCRKLVGSEHTYRIRIGD
jgi:mRNA interferase RelE/StbE